MRWKNKKHNIGDVKTVRKFLWLPLTIKNETRWFEFAYVTYVYTVYLNPYDVEHAVKYGWRAIKFMI
jgi:hypothetical protein